MASKQLVPLLKLVPVLSHRLRQRIATVTTHTNWRSAIRKKSTLLLPKKITSQRLLQPPRKISKEFRDFTVEKALGESITVDIFTEGEKVDVVGTTKGKGFQGVVKRHGFHGVGEQSHGQHDRQRAPGSLGNSSDAARVMKGMRMAGRMGNDRVKLKGLKVVKIFADKNYILISGSVPGHIGSIVYIQK